MNTCRFEKNVEAWHDGEMERDDAVRAHLEACPHCREHAARLAAIRAGVGAVRETAEITDAQFGAFMAGIAERIETPRRTFGGLWAMASLMAAALIMATALYSIMAGGPEPVSAQNEVVEVHSDLDGAVCGYQYSDEVTRVYVKKGDL